MNSTELISNFDSKGLLQNSFKKVQELLFEVTLVVMNAGHRRIRENNRDAPSLVESRCDSLWNQEGISCCNFNFS